MSFVEDLKTNHSVRILITSREHVQEINDGLKTECSVLIEANPEDLAKYIYHRLRDPRLKCKLDDSLCQKITDRLLETAAGVYVYITRSGIDQRYILLTRLRFLLVVIRLQSILDEPTPGDMEDALDALSCDLTGAFRDTINRICRLPPRRARLGMDTLMWTSNAERSLTISELSEALAIRPDRLTFR